MCFRCMGYVDDSNWKGPKAMPLLESNPLYDVVFDAWYNRQMGDGPSQARTDCMVTAGLFKYGILRKGAASYMTQGAEADKVLSSCPSVLFLFIVHILIQVHAHWHAGSNLLGQTCQKKWFASNFHPNRKVSLSTTSNRASGHAPCDLVDEPRGPFVPPWLSVLRILGFWFSPLSG